MESNRITRSERNEKTISEFLKLTEESYPEITIPMILYPSEATRYRKKFPIEITESPNSANKNSDLKLYIIRRKL